MITIGIAAPLGGQSTIRKPLDERRFALIDRDNLDEVFGRLAPELHFQVPNALASGGLLARLRFSSVEQLEPLAVARQLAPLKQILEGGPVDVPVPPAPAPASPPSLAPPPNLLDEILEQQPTAGGMQQDSPFVQSLVAHAMQGTTTYKKADDSVRRAAMANLSEQLALVLHHPAFQRLEAAWRGLQRLVYSADTGPDLKLRVIDARPDELADIAEKAFGGEEAFSLLLVDHAFGPEDLALLRQIAGKAHQAGGRVVAGARPSLLGVDCWSKWVEARKDSGAPAELKEWDEFRREPAARCVTLALPRVMARLPYGTGAREAEGLAEFEEGERWPSGKPKELPHDDYLWMNAAWVYVEALLRGASQVDRLPVHAYDAEGEMEMKCPAEVRLTDKHAALLHELGLLGVAHMPRSDRAGFVGSTALGPK